jgi:hypothetical protein
MSAGRPCSRTLPIYIPCVVTISVTIAAFEAIKSTLPDDADAFPPELGEPGGVRFVVDRKTLDRLIAPRGSGASYSDVILRLARASSER